MAHETPLIDPRAYQQVLDVIRVKRLAEIDQQLVGLVRTININRPSKVDVRAWTVLQERVQGFMSALQERPFLPGPPTISDGLFTLGTVGGIPFRLTPQELLRHALYAGPSGSGKTTAQQPLALQFRQKGGHVAVADFKGDLTWLAARDPDFLILHPDVPLNILDHPGYVERSDYINLIITLLTRSYYGGEHLRQVAHETLWESYRQHEHPSIKDWHQVTKERLSPKDTYQRRDAYNGLLMRLTRMMEQLPGMTRTKVGIPHATLWEHSVYLGALHQNDNTEFLTAWTVHSYYLHARAHQARNTLRYLILLDEGLLTFGEGNRIDGPVLLPLVPLLREYGAALAITTAHLGAIHETIRANVYTTIVLPLANATDAATASRSLGLDQAQAAYLLQLQPGQAILRSGKWRAPLLLEFPPLPYTKEITEQEWQDAIQRTNQHAPHDTPPAVTTPAIASTAPPEADAMPVVQPVKPVGLSVAEEALQRTVAKASIITVSEAYKAANLPAQVGDRAAKKTESLGFLTRTPIVVRPGRGGTAVALQLTTLGYDRLHLKPAHGLRGGSSAQHTYLVLQLARQIPGAMVETALGGSEGSTAKSIDVLFRVTAEHDQVMNAIASNNHRLCEEAASVSPGDLVAIEIEASDPRKTASQNATADLNVGAALVVIATMPKAVDAAQRVLSRDVPSDQLARVMLVDALELVEALRQ